jgi:hypothetical protein
VTMILLRSTDTSTDEHPLWQEALMGRTDMVAQRFSPDGWGA